MQGSCHGKAEKRRRKGLSTPGKVEDGGQTTEDGDPARRGEAASNKGIRYPQELKPLTTYQILCALSYQL